MIGMYRKKEILKRINGLQAMYPDGVIMQAFVTLLANGQWECDVRVLYQRRKRNRTETITSVHDTEEEALTRIDQLAKKYPMQNDVPVYIDKGLSELFGVCNTSELVEIVTGATDGRLSEIFEAHGIKIPLPIKNEKEGKER